MRQVNVLLCAVLAISVAHVARAAENGAIAFYCDLTSGETLNSTSAAMGRADLSLDRETLKLSWKLTFSGLTAPPTKIGIHAPAVRGGNAALAFDIGKSGMKSPVTGSWTLTDGEVEFLFQRLMYIDIATPTYKEGEIRCQIEKVPVRTPRTDLKPTN